jgi:hypothetical protein
VHQQLVTSRLVAAAAAAVVLVVAVLCHMKQGETCQEWGACVHKQAAAAAQAGRARVKL